MYNNSIAQEKFTKKIDLTTTFWGGAPQVVRLKWEFTGTPTIFKNDYRRDYVAVDSNGRRNRQHNTIIIVKLRMAMEHTAG
jgi:hypothetical protein